MMYFKTHFHGQFDDTDFNMEKMDSYYGEKGVARSLEIISVILVKL